MTDNYVQVLGICRWSYPSDAQKFKKAAPSLDETRAKLYAPHRLEHRLFLLEHILLPCLKKQRDQDFTLVFVMGENLPEPYRSRVLGLIATVPQIRPVFAEEGHPQFDICRNAINEVVDRNAVATAQFRLDDDDAVSADFVRRTRMLFPQIRPFYQEGGLFGLDFCRGFIMESTEQDCSFRPISMRFWAPGMVIFISPDKSTCALDYHHLSLWQDMPTLVWMEKPMFLRGIHHDNDSDVSNYGRRSRSFPFNMDRLEGYMARRFGIDVPKVQQLWRAGKAQFMAHDKAA